MRIKLPPLTSASNELLHLDFLRFVASLGIVFHHSHEFFYSPSDRSAAMALATGFGLFVDLFFIISGYVIAHVYRGRVSTLAEVAHFLQRRCGRLLPIHWVTLAFNIAAWGIMAQFARGNHQPDFSPICIVNSALLLQAVIPCGTFQFNSVTWSISAEMVMYIMFPFISILAARLRSLPLSAGVSIFAAVFVLTYRIHFNHLASWLQLHPVLRALPSFLLGTGLCYSSPAIIARLPFPQMTLGISLVLLIYVMVANLSEPIQLLLVLSVGVSAIACDVRQSAGRLIRSLAPMGQLTFSIYMWHRLFIFVFMNLIGDKLLHGHTVAMIILTVFTYCVVFVWSYFSFAFVETPARRAMDGLFNKKQKKFTA